jgi:hypothetical protein
MTAMGAPRTLDRLRILFFRHAWLCPLLALLLAAAVAVAFGLSVGTAVLVALLLVCPAIMAWGLVVTLRPPRRRTPGVTEPTHHDGGRHAQ